MNPSPSNSAPSALLTFSIGPVHTFITQARKVADLWAGSQLLSHLVTKAVKIARRHGEMIHPYIREKGKRPSTLTNRFVCRLPLDQVEDLAVEMSEEIEREWQALVGKTANYLTDKTYGVKIKETLWQPNLTASPQAKGVIQSSWSWVEEGTGTYEQSANHGASLSRASRLFRPFEQMEEELEKCAVCGERTALPDGHREHVRHTWNKLAQIERDKGQKDTIFFREGQTRLCLPCTAKRLYPMWSDRDDQHQWRTNAYGRFKPFESYQVSEERRYFALVAMDGDHLSRVFGWDQDYLLDGDIHTFHKQVSLCLTRFAESLSSKESAKLNVGEMDDYSPADPNALPQLIFAGGEDVRFVCHARDALALTRIVRERYRAYFREMVFPLVKPKHHHRLTISAGILYAHVKHSAGLLFRDVTTLLDEKAKRETQRDAVAIRLAKRSGVPVEIAFKWDDKLTEADSRTWLEAFEEIVGWIASGRLSSSSSFDLRIDERVLHEVFDKPERWQGWLTQQLRRDGLGEANAVDFATLLTPFFYHQRTAALRIARFLGREIQP